MIVTMKINIKYFASIREAIGVSSQHMDTEALTVGALRDTLIAQGAPYADALERGKLIRTALNQTMCDESELLKNTCEVAFFPPVTGG
jgi:molybdopterin synthase sulfur carrier subunit